MEYRLTKRSFWNLGLKLLNLLVRKNLLSLVELRLFVILKVILTQFKNSFCKSKGKQQSYKGKQSKIVKEILLKY